MLPNIDEIASSPQPISQSDSSSQISRPRRKGSVTLSVHDLIPNHQNTPSSSPGGAKLWGFSTAGLIAGQIAGQIKEEKAGGSGRALWPLILLRLADLGTSPQPPTKRENSQQHAAEESGLAGGTRGRGVRQARQAATRCAPVCLPAYQPTTPPYLPARLPFGGFFSC